MQYVLWRWRSLGMDRVSPRNRQSTLSRPLRSATACEGGRLRGPWAARNALERFHPLEQLHILDHTVALDPPAKDQSRAASGSTPRAPRPSPVLSHRHSDLQAIRESKICRLSRNAGILQHQIDALACPLLQALRDPGKPPGRMARLHLDAGRRLMLCLRRLNKFCDRTSLMTPTEKSKKRQGACQQQHDAGPRSPWLEDEGFHCVSLAAGKRDVNDNIRRRRRAWREHLAGCGRQNRTCGSATPNERVSKAAQRAQRAIALRSWPLPGPNCVGRSSYIALNNGAPQIAASRTTIPTRTQTALIVTPSCKARLLRPGKI
ncbi:hypothetical protein C8D03_3036 [Bosea sp. 124]|nr:hypothetical protein C8D03_3036 [Bosea sp. 124]